jgi:hypothetical protein
MFSSHFKTKNARFSCELTHSRSRDTSVCNQTRLKAGRPRNRDSIPGRSKRSLFSIASRLALGPTQSPIQRLSELVLWGWSGQGVKLTTQLHLVSRLRIRYTTKLPHPPSWRGEISLLKRFVSWFWLIIGILFFFSLTKQEPINYTYLMKPRDNFTLPCSIQSLNFRSLAITRNTKIHSMVKI